MLVAPKVMWEVSATERVGMRLPHVKAGLKVAIPKGGCESHTKSGKR